jgi:hypothetical protein
MQTEESTMDETAVHRSGGATRRRVLGGISLGMVYGLAGCVGYTERDRQTATEEFSVAGERVDRIVVHGDDGETTVRGWDGTDVRVEATKYAVGETDLSSVRVSRSVTGGRLSIGVEVPQGFSFGPSGGGLETLDVRVPRDVRVERVGIDDGTARVTDVVGDLALSVDDGTVEADGVDGAVDVSADDGEVTVGAVANVGGEIGDGRLRMSEGAIIGDLTTDDGDFDLAIQGLDGEVTIQCDDGTVEAALAPTLDATVEIHSDDGSVRIEEGVLDSIETTEGTTRGTVGDGSGQLTIRIDDGDVRLSPLSTAE